MVVGSSPTAVINWVPLASDRVPKLPNWGISSPDPPEEGIQLWRCDKVIGSDIFNIQLGSVATQLGVSYYIQVTFFICLA